MKVAIACEASSFLLKEAVKKRIQAAGYEVLDVGQQTENENVLYFEAAQNLAKVIQSGECEKGIVICGTGAGVSMIVNKFRGVMLDNGLYGLCFYDNGTRNFFFTEAEVHNPSDMANLAIRVQESNLMLGMVRAMGANPTSMAASELYSALQTGVVNGAENNLPWYLSMSLNEVAPMKWRL